MVSSSAPGKIDKTENSASADPLDALLEASASLLSSPAVASVLPRVLELARRVIVADAYALWRVSEGIRWNVVASADLPVELQAEVVASEAKPGAISREPYFIADVLSEGTLALRREL